MNDKDLIFIKDGQQVSVPEREAEAYQRANPNAASVYIADGRKYGVSPAKRDAFLQRFPQAQLLDAKSVQRQQTESALGVQRTSVAPEPAKEPIVDPDYGDVLRQQVNAYRQEYNNEWLAHNRQLGDKARKEREDYISGAKTGVGRFFRSVGYNNPYPTDGDSQLYGQALNILDKTETLLDAVKDDKDGTFVGGVLRGFRDGAFDIDTWTMGISGSKDASRLMDAVDKAESGKDLTAGEQALLNAAAVDIAVNGYYADRIGRGYKAGKVTAESLPFMIEMAINPASALGKGIGSRIVRAAVKKGLGKATTKAVGAAARVAGDVAGAAAMTATTGQGRVIEDMFTRQAGTIVPTANEQGRIEYGGSINRLSPAEAYSKAFTATAIENYSEMFGDYFPAIGKAVGKVPGVSHALNVLNTAKATDVGKFINTVAKKTQFNGTVGEFAEELVSGALNAIFVGDQTLDTDPETGVFNKDNLIDTFLGVAIMGGVFGAANLSAVPYAMQLQSQLSNINQMGKDAVSTPTMTWDDITADIDRYSGSASELQGRLSRYMADNNLTAEQKKIIADYAGVKARTLGYAMAQQSIPDDVAPSSRLLRSYNDALITGEANRDNMQQLSAVYNSAVEAYNAMTEQERSISPQDLMTYVDNHPERYNTIEQFVRSKAVLNSAYYSTVNAVQDAFRAAKAKIEPFADVQGRVVYVETASGNKYVTGGNIEVDDKGFVIPSKSSAAIIVKNEDGRTEMISPDAITRVIDSSSVDDVAVREAGATAQETADKFLQSITQMSEEQIMSYLIPGKMFYDTQGGSPVAIEIRAVQPGTTGMEVIYAVGDQVLSMDAATFANQYANQLGVMPTDPAIADAIFGVQNETITAVADQETEQLTAPETTAEESVTEETTEEATPPVAEETGFVELPVEEEQRMFDTDPVAWARYNDARIANETGQSDNGTDSQQFINAEIKRVSKLVDKAKSDYDNATTIADRKAKRDNLSSLRARQNALQSAIDSYNAAQEPEPVLTKNKPVAKPAEASQSLKDRWNAARKETGWDDTYVLANGEEIKGKYVLVEASTPVASHDPNRNFAMTEGFPVDESGRTVNDRDYQSDKDAQQLVRNRARDYDIRALQNPVIVSQEGVVLSGNDRTMSSQIAAVNGTDAKYVSYLKDNARKYGFTPEQVESFTNPRVVFVVDGPVEYNANTFAKFNLSDTKTQSKTEKAVKAGKIISDELFDQIAQIFSNFDTLKELYRDTDSVRDLINLMQRNGIITLEQIPELTDNEGLSGAGIDFIENTIVGNVLREDALRKALADKAIRRSIVSAISPIVQNRRLADGYNLTEEMSDAVVLLSDAKTSKVIKINESIELYMRQQNLFGDNPVAAATVQILANAMNTTKSTMLRQVLSDYNGEASQASTGQINMFTGDVRDKEDILRDILKQLGYETERIKDQTEQQAEPAGEQTDTATQSVGKEPGEQTETVTKQEEIESARGDVNVEPTDAQKEAGNYKKGHITLDGRKVTIENPKGSVRKGVDENGKPWQVTITHDYGYFRGTEGVDGDHIDVIIGDNLDSDTIYVVDQVDRDGNFDEHKVIYGFGSYKEAKDAYMSMYEPGWYGFGKMTAVSKDRFYKWIDSSHRKTKAFSEYSQFAEKQEKMISDTLAALNESLNRNLIIIDNLYQVNDADIKDRLSKGDTISYWKDNNGRINVFVPNISADNIENITAEIVDMYLAGKTVAMLAGEDAANNFSLEMWKQVDSARKKEEIRKMAGRELSVIEYATFMSNPDVQMAVANTYLAEVADDIRKDNNAHLDIQQRVKDITGMTLSPEQVASLLENHSLTSTYRTNAEIFMSNNRELTEEEILALPIDETLKTGAIQYLRGNTSMAVAMSYQIVKQYVRDRSQLSAADRAAADAALMGTEDNDTVGRTGRQDGRADSSMDNRDGEEGISTEQPGREDSQDGMASSSGEQGDSNVEAAGAVSGDERSGDGDTAGSSRVRGKRGDVRKPAGQRGGRKGAGTNAKRGADTNISEQSADDIINSALGDIEEILKNPGNVRMGQLYDATYLVAQLGANALKLFVATAKLGYGLLKKGYISFDKWKRNMHQSLDDLLHKHTKLDDNQIDEFITSMWDYPMTIGEETHTVGEWAGIMEQEQLRKALSMTIEEKRELQKKAEKTETVIGDIDNIRESLPFLLPEQQNDVQKAETQFFDASHSDAEHGNGKGYMFTNGTGTGKTYTGLGIVKRFVKQGKGRILIVTAQSKKIEDWINDAKNLYINASMLPDTKSKGAGVVVTQYANIRQNYELLKDEFDLIVYDESHKLMENQQGQVTTTATFHHMLSNRDVESAIVRKLMNTELWIRERELNALIAKYRELMMIEPNKEQLKEIADLGGLSGIEQRIDAANSELNDIYDKQSEAIDKAKKDPAMVSEAQKAVDKTKVVFLSATPFNTAFSLDYVEGYIFSYPEVEGRELTRDQRRSSFIMNNFGASHTKDKKGNVAKKSETAITDPDEVSKEEITFSDYLQNTLNTMSGRSLDSAYDYSREFPIVDIPVVRMFNKAVQEITNGKYRGLLTVFDHLLNDYPTMTALFETIKTAGVIKRLQQHVNMGRKVVVFHRRLSSSAPLTPPFETAMKKAAMSDVKGVRNMAKMFAEEFAPLFAWEQTIDYSFPHDQITKAFATKEDFDTFDKLQKEWNEKAQKAIKENKKIPPQPKMHAQAVGLFNGAESDKYRKQVIDEFNRDGSPMNILVVQVAAGKEGISLHDVTGKHQRAEISLYLPQSPIEFIQAEGRIYRVGNKSNAIFEYPLLGINIELASFAAKINGRSQTAENLALGSRSRGLRESIARAALSARDIPVSQDQGIGGKKLDNRLLQEATGYDTAISNYAEWANSAPVEYNEQEVPDPIGYKVAEWMNVSNGETVMIANAGTGTVARYSPKVAKLIAVEPNMDKFSRLVTLIGGGGRKVENEVFEDFSIYNKADTVFIKTTSGKEKNGKPIALKQIMKALRHTNDSGRVIAIVPTSDAQSIVSEITQNSSVVINTSEVKLPASAFNSTETTILSFDLIFNNELRKTAPDKQVFDLTDKNSKEELFESLRGLSLPARTIDEKGKIARKMSRFLSKFESLSIVSTRSSWNGKKRVKEKSISISDYGIDITFNSGTITFKNPPGHRGLYRSFNLSFDKIVKKDVSYIQQAAELWVQMDELTKMSDEQLKREVYSEKDIDEVIQAAELIKDILSVSLGKTGTQMRNTAKGIVDNALTGELTFDEFKDAFIAMNKDNAELEALADKVFGAISRIEGIRFDVLPTIREGSSGTTAAYYSPSENMVRLNGEFFNSARVKDETKAQVLLHELIHAVTSYALYTYETNPSLLNEEQRQACADIMEVYNIVNSSEFRTDVRLSSKLGDNAEYLLTNPDELVAELSNPVTRAALKAKKLWRQAINGIKRLLGINVTQDGEETDALRVLDNALETLIENYDPALYNRYVTIARESSRSSDIADKPVDLKKVVYDTTENVSYNPDRVSTVERVYRTTGQFSFVGKDKVSTYNDIAYIFKELENSAIENAFVVLVKNGKPKIVHIGMGTINASLVDFSAVRLAYDKFGADKIYIVHNHPSGNLVCSNNDISMLKTLRDMFRDKAEVGKGIIINTTSGKYGLFDMEKGEDAKSMPKRQKGTLPLDVYVFDKVVFSKDYNPKDVQIKSEETVASLVSSSRFGKRDKISYLVLSNDLRVIGNVHTEYVNISDNINEIAEDIASSIVAWNGTSAIIYGRTSDNSSFITNRIDGEVSRMLGKRSQSVLDIVNIREDTAEYNKSSDQLTEDNLSMTADVMMDIQNAAKETASAVNVSIEFIPKDKLPKRYQDAKGFYLNGKIFVCPENHKDTDDVRATVLHEAVGHLGLRKLFGNNFNKFLSDVYDSMPENMRREVINRAMEYGITRKGAVNVGVEEYLSEMAETFNFNDAGARMWVTIKSLFMKMLRKAGLKFASPISDAELRYMLILSYDNLRGKNDGVFGVMKRRLLERNYGLNGMPESGMTENNAEMRPSDEGASSIDVTVPETSSEDIEERYRRTAYMSDYDMRMEDSSVRLTEEWFDGMISVDVLQKTLSTDKPLKEYEDAYTAEIHRSSKNRAETEQYMERFFKPIMDTIKGITNKYPMLTYDDISRYVMSKHGLERNAHFENKTGDRRDYSGLTSMFSADDVDAAEEAARNYVSYVESFDGISDLIDNLWGAINRATKESLKKSLMSGVIDKEMYDNINGMFQNYVPLRGFEEEISEDVYEYITSPTLGYSPAVKKAKGRTSMAGDPFANIAMIGASTIAQGNKNLVKMRLVNLAQNRPGNGVLIPRRVWYRNYGTEATPDWQVALPSIPDDAVIEEVNAILEQFDKDMRELEEKGEATQMRNKIKTSLRTLGPQQLNEHIVRAKIGGREYMVFINGNPRAAQALNGLLQNDLTSFEEKIRTMNRWLSANYTTRSPKFVVRNLTRDTIYSLFSTGIRENNRYFRRFAANLFLNYGRIGNLLRKYKKGTLGNSEIERYMNEFIINGGETGYTLTRKEDEYKRIIKKYIDGSSKAQAQRNWNAVLEVIDFANRCAEDMSRFACYVTSRQLGRSVERSIADAKNITINFNKKGLHKSAPARLAATSYLFFNAAMQGLGNFVKLGKDNPVKFTIFTSATLGLGMLIPFINGVISGMLGGDDDEYFDMPEWLRRSNMMIGGDGFYVSVPLPIDLKAIYGIGDIAYSAMAGKMKHKNIALELTEQISSMLPLDPVSGEGSIGALVPDVLSPIYQAYVTNTDFTGRPIYMEYDFNELYPEYTKAYAGTNKALVKSAVLLNAATGGDIATRGSVNINPARIEHVAQGYLGGLATFFNEIYKTTSMAWDPEARQMRNIPIANVFLQQNDERTMSSYINDLYYYYKEESEIYDIQKREYRKDMDYIDKYTDVRTSNKAIRTKLFKKYDGMIKDYTELMLQADTQQEKDMWRMQINELKERAINEIMQYE